MSNLFSGINARLRKSPAPPNAPYSPPEANNNHAGPSYQTGLNYQTGLINQQTGPASHSVGGQPSANLGASLPPLPTTPSLAQTIGMETSTGKMPTGDEVLASYRLPAPKPLWLNANHAKHIVRGNFMTLSARPKTVEMGEWMAHQVVEHWRMLITFIKLVHEKEDDGFTVCNARKCPKMSAGPNHSFTWLNSQLQPVEIPAYEYLTLVQRYIGGKIDDSRIFPTDPAGVSYADNPAFCAPSVTNDNSSSSDGGGDWIGKRSGFPKNFMEVCQTIFRQMFRVYAHLYWSHFEDPMYHMSLEKSMNSCFSHFVLTATTLDLLKPGDLEPMQALMDLWAANGTFPRESKAYQYANVQAGERLLQLAGVSTG